MNEPDALVPAWLRELDGALGTHSQFVLTGNVRDMVLTRGPDGAPLITDSVLEALWQRLADNGYRFLLVYDAVDGLRLHPNEPEAAEAAAPAIGEIRARHPMTLEALPEMLGRVVFGEVRGAVLIDYAARLAPDPRQLTVDQQTFFAACEKLSHAASTHRADGPRRVQLFNPVLWTCSSERELPPWFATGNESVRVVSIPRPDLGRRSRVAEMLARSFDDFLEADPDEQRQLIDRFTQQTQGLTLRAMFSISLLARDQQLGMRHIEDAARAYRVGVLDNPWRDDRLRERISGGEAALGGQVLGQPSAVRTALDIVMRSVTGLTGAHASPYATRPRGILFFAGPTGVGKTELAKALTRLLFGDEQAYVRFDMSEFAAEHAADRLIGSPPGYVGFDAGGELTNAIRQQPFSVVLFDEIEKAHPKILDKFLQVLEDGRLTDGQGATVFFTETLLIFTSNLGVWVPGPDGQRVAQVTEQTERDEAERLIRGEIERYFKEELGRPELLNRLGDNIVIFDFIDPATAGQILDLLVGNVSRRVEREHRVTLTIAPEAHDQLRSLALADLSNGGRGIGSVVETHLVNPLARDLFARPRETGGEVVVRALRSDNGTHDLELA